MQMDPSVMSKTKMSTESGSPPPTPKKEISFFLKPTLNKNSKKPVTLKSLLLSLPLSLPQMNQAQNSPEEVLVVLHVSTSVLQPLHLNHKSFFFISSLYYHLYLYFYVLTKCLFHQYLSFPIDRPAEALYQSEKQLAKP